MWKKFTQSAQKAANSLGDKTKDVVSVTRLSTQLAASNTDLEKVYIDIGKKCVLFLQEHPEHAPETDELRQLCASVGTLTKAIAALQFEIDEIRKVRRCPQCGEVSPKTQRFCGSCGERFFFDSDADIASAEDGNTLTEEPASVNPDAIIPPETLALAQNQTEPSETLETPETPESAAPVDLAESTENSEDNV